MITAILKNDPVLGYTKEGDPILNFTACNTERIVGHGRRVQNRRVVWIDCHWIYPVEGHYERFKARTVVYLEGMIYLRPFTRENGSQGLTLALDVSHANFVQQMVGVGPPDRSAEKNS